MVEKAVDILQRALKKNVRDPSKWPLVLKKSTHNVNKRDILHLGYSPHGILKGFTPDRPLEATLSSYYWQSLKSSLTEDTSEAFPKSDDTHSDMVLDFIIRREEIRRKTLSKSDYQKDRVRQRHDLGVRQRHTFTPGQLVMLWDEKTVGKKLRAAWRGPFIVAGLGGEMGKFYTLRQVDGSPIPRHYYGDHLRPF